MRSRSILLWSCLSLNWYFPVPSRARITKTLRETPLSGSLRHILDESNPLPWLRLRYLRGATLCEWSSLRFSFSIKVAQWAFAFIEESWKLTHSLRISGVQLHRLQEGTQIHVIRVMLFIRWEVSSALFSPPTRKWGLTCPMNGASWVGYGMIIHLIWNWGNVFLETAKLEDSVDWADGKINSISVGLSLCTLPEHN